MSAPTIMRVDFARVLFRRRVCIAQRSTMDIVTVTILSIECSDQLKCSDKLLVCNMKALERVAVGRVALVGLARPRPGRSAQMFGPCALLA